MKVTEEQIMNAILKTINKTDVPQFEKIAGFVIGGEFKWLSEENTGNLDPGEDLYEFKPNQNYKGIFPVGVPNDKTKR